MKLVLPLILWSALFPVAEASQGDSTSAELCPSAVTATTRPAPDIRIADGRPLKNRSSCSWQESAFVEEDSEDSDDLSFCFPTFIELPDLARAVTKVARRPWEKPRPEARYSILLC